MSRVDTAIRSAAGVTVVGLAGIAGAISYSHMTELAHAHGEIGWRAHMFPLSVDGIEIVASLVLLADKRAGRGSGLLPWAALIAGTGASFAANIAVGGSDWIGRAVSGWPAFALLIAVKLLFGLLDHPSAGPVAEVEAEPVQTVQGQPGTVSPVLDGTAGPVRIAEGGGGTADGYRDVPDDGDRTVAINEPAPDPVRVLPSTHDVSTLLPAARDARAKLLREGISVSRDALARQLRSDGHAASNTRVSAVLKALGREKPTDAAAV